MSDMHDTAMHLEVETMFGIVIGVGIPTLLWSWKMFAMVKEMLAMHQIPDKYGFGTGDTNSLIAEQTAMLSKMHNEREEILRNLTTAIRELSHFMEWVSKEQLGGSPPPYIHRRSGIGDKDD